MTTAEQRLISQRDRYLNAVGENWRGHERELLITLVRGLDVAAYNLCIARDGAERDPEASMRMRGAATALQPLLEKVKNMPGGIPWFPTNPDYVLAFDNHLLACGRFAAAIRLAAMERYGLTTATVVADDRIVIEAISDAEESAEVDAGHVASARARHGFLAQRPDLAAQSPEVCRRIDRYGYAAMGWFIGYDNDEFLIEHYKALAGMRTAGVAEAEALPPAAMIGGRPFSEWRDASTAAFGAVLHHIDAAGRLRDRKPRLDMRDLMTIFARREDIVEVLAERGNNRMRAMQLMAGLTLDAEGAASYESRHEIPLPYYIDAGEHFVLLPMFGGLMNPHAGLLDHLRRTYRSDWDRIIDGREDIFRKDLHRLLPEPRYKVLKHGLKLRRKDRSHLTDVDAVVLDRQIGSVVLVQLKWYDAHGFSLAERDSRRDNLLTKGNEWVGKVHGWIDGRTSAELARTYNWGEAAEAPPLLLVMARHASRFAGETRYDPRASWMSWHGLTEQMQKPGCDGFLAAIESGRRLEPSADDPHATVLFELPGMNVEVRIVPRLPRRRES